MAMPDGDWGEEYLREMDERKRQGERAYHWRQRAERYRIALEEIRLHAEGQTTQYARARATVAQLARDALQG